MARTYAARTSRAEHGYGASGTGLTQQRVRNADAGARHHQKQRDQGISELLDIAGANTSSAVKNNQPTLAQAIKGLFAWARPASSTRQSSAARLGYVVFSICQCTAMPCCANVVKL